MGNNSTLSNNQLNKLDEIFKIQELTGFVIKTNAVSLSVAETLELNSTSIMNVWSDQTALKGILSILGN